MRSVGSRISPHIVKRIKDICHERFTYGYRRIWALLRNEGINLNQKAVEFFLKYRLLWQDPLHMRSACSRISPHIVKRIKDICHERVTYGYRRIKALLRNEGINLNQKAVLKTMKNEKFSVDPAYIETEMNGRVFPIQMIPINFRKPVSYKFPQSMKERHTCST